jgi:hemolysin activation/secretion protein
MSGINKNLQGNIEILLFRNQIMKTSLKTGLISKERQGYNGDITIDNQTDHKILYTIALSQTIYNYFGNWFTNLIYTQSFSGMGATKDSINLSISDPHQQFKKYNLDLNWSQNIDLFTKTSTPSSNPIHSTFRFQSNLSAQYSPEVTLLDTERISIGDYYTVRGYINNQVGDCGYYIRNELSYSLSSLFLALHPYDWANYTMLIHGIDIGYVYKNYGTDNNGQKAAKLISGILGIKYFGLNHNWDLTYAIPLTTSMADNTGIWYFGTTINL